VTVALLVVALAACGKSQVSAADASVEPVRIKGGAYVSRRVASCLPVSVHDVKACASDDDCVVIDVIASCCGTVHMMGVSKHHVASVMACRPKDRFDIAPCGCAQTASFTDDRLTSALDYAMPRVTCARADDGSRECRTYWDRSRELSGER
jgi:hypothetical protein